MCSRMSVYSYKDYLTGEMLLVSNIQCKKFVIFCKLLKTSLLAFIAVLADLLFLGAIVKKMKQCGL